MWVPSLSREDPLEKEMATHSSILAWKIPWTEDPGGLQSMGSQRVGHDLATKQQLRQQKDKYCVALLIENIWDRQFIETENSLADTQDWEHGRRGYCLICTEFLYGC